MQILKRATCQHFPVIAFALVALLLANCGRSGSKTQLDKTAGEGPIKEQANLINEHISDSEKRAELITILEDWEIELAAFNKKYQEHKDIITALQLDYDAKPAQFDEEFETMNVAYESILNSLIAKRSAMTALTTEEEWALISVKSQTFVPSPERSLKEE